MKKADYEPLLRAALAEDLGRSGDLTTRFFIAPRARLRGRIVSRERGVVCGLNIAAAAFSACDRSARIRFLARDGDRVRPGQALLEVRGGRGLLTAERTALNFLQRLSGIASLTRRYVDRVRGTRAKILDTRKTIPGWRALDKYAVACGGGVNHRMGLYDAVMVKDNHYRGESLERGVRNLRRSHPTVALIIECDTMSQVSRAVALKPQVILLDNMRGVRLSRAIRRIRELDAGVLVEVSGGVGYDDVRALAGLGPDRISVGRVTHSAPALDLGFDLIP
ncbi:MAG: carboxylating nicotinate-nucleotide diphosphorylase [Elusimicrobiota bacterium]